MTMKKARLMMRKQLIVAIKLQTQFRSHRRITIAVADLITQRRKFLNPYKECLNCSQVLQNVKETIHKIYDTEDPWAGLGLPTVLQRLGLLDLLPLLNNANIHSMLDLSKLRHRQLEAIGIIDHKINTLGNKHTSEFVVEYPNEVRTLLIDFCKLFHLDASTRAMFDESSYEYDLINKFEILSFHQNNNINQNQESSYEIANINVNKKMQIIVKLFEEVYTNKFTSRANNFAESLIHVDVTCHQLIRFFKLHQTPAKAKENISKLIHFEYQASELLYDEKRLISCCDKLRYGAEKCRDLIVENEKQDNKKNAVDGNNHEEENNAISSIQLKDGFILSMMKLIIKKTTEISSFRNVENMQLKRKAYIEQNGNLAYLSGPQGAIQNQNNNSFNTRDDIGTLPMVKNISNIQNIWNLIIEQNNATSFLQNSWRGYAGRNLLKHQMEAVYKSKISKRYIEERSTNRVRLIWEEDRRIEKLEYERSYKEFIKLEEEKVIKEQLSKITRYGYEEIVKEEDSDEIVYRLIGDESDTAILSKRPIYTIEENKATLYLQKYFLSCHAIMIVKRLRHERTKASNAIKQHEIWEKKKLDRERHVTLTFKIDVLNQTNVLSSIKDEEADLQGYELKCKENMNALLDQDAELIVGFPIEARFEKGDNYYPGTIYQMNPTQYSTPEGMKWYPAGTCGVVYDDGDYEPAVSFKYIRVIRVRKGFQVEAKYGGHPSFFNGTVIGENYRDGKVLSYQIEYDDGEIEKAVPRNRIRIDPEQLLKFQINWDKQFIHNETEIARRRNRIKHKKLNQTKRNESITTSLNHFDKAWGSQHPTPIQSSSTSSSASSSSSSTNHAKLTTSPSNSHWSSLMSSNVPKKPSPLKSILNMLSSSRDLFHTLRPNVNIGIHIEYTRLPMRYAWQELTTENKKFYYLNIHTQETSWIRPTFTFIEEQACKLLQSHFRALLGRAEFERRLNSESILNVVNHCKVEASKQAWIGYYKEGLTLDLWLNQMGLNKLYDIILKAANRMATRKNLPSPSHHDIINSLQGASMETLKSLYDIESSADRRVLISLRGRSNTTGGGGGGGDSDELAVINKEEENALKQLKFINGFNGPQDERTIKQCILESRELLVKLLSQTFKGNPTRVEKMADEVIKSKYPITYAQLSKFLSEYEGKPAMAQDHIKEELVNIPTRHPPSRESLCYQVLKRGARRLVVLASNLNVGIMKNDLEKVIMKADCMFNSGSFDGPGTAMNAFMLNNKDDSLQSIHHQDSLLESFREGDDDDDVGGHASKAALLLRIEAIEAAKLWWFSTIKIQTCFRRHVALKAWQHFLLNRDISCLLIQSLWRGYKAREFGEYLKLQQISLWEELWSEESGVFYYFNKETGEALWERPQHHTYRFH